MILTDTQLYCYCADACAITTFRLVMMWFDIVLARMFGLHASWHRFLFCIPQRHVPWTRDGKLLKKIDAGERHKSNTSIHTLPSAEVLLTRRFLERAEKARKQVRHTSETHQFSVKLQTYTDGLFVSRPCKAHSSTDQLVDTFYCMSFSNLEGDKSSWNGGTTWSTIICNAWH